MYREQVGTLVVMDPGAGELPIGFVTDRDIVTRCVAAGLDPDAESVASIMTVPVTTIHEDASVEDAVTLMSEVTIRRLVVTDSRNRLVGVLALDDVLECLAGEATAIGRLLPRHPPALL
jgi:CBS domain-containing protein